MTPLEVTRVPGVPDISAGESVCSFAALGFIGSPAPPGVSVLVGIAFGEDAITTPVDTTLRPS